MSNLYTSGVGYTQYAQMVAFTLQCFKDEGFFFHIFFFFFNTHVLRMVRFFSLNFLLLFFFTTAMRVINAMCILKCTRSSVLNYISFTVVQGLFFFIINNNN